MPTDEQNKVNEAITRGCIQWLTTMAPFAKLYAATHGEQGRMINDDQPISDQDYETSKRPKPAREEWEHVAAGIEGVGTRDN